MSFDERGIYISLLAASWNLHEPGTIPLPLSLGAKVVGIHPTTLRRFLSLYPQTFIEKDGRLVNDKLRNQWLHLEEVRKQRSYAANVRHGHANAPAKDTAKNQTASAVAVATAKSTTNTPPLPAAPYDLVSVLEDLCKTIPKQDRSDSHAFQKAVETRLLALGYMVSREWKVPDRGDGAPGFIDLVVTQPVRFGLELDRITPRKKSIFKLSRFGTGFVLLREGFKNVMSLTELQKPGRRNGASRDAQVRAEARVGSGPEVPTKPEIESERIRHHREIGEDWERKRKSGEIPRTLGKSEYRSQVLENESKQKSKAAVS